MRVSVDGDNAGNADVAATEVEVSKTLVVGLSLVTMVIGAAGGFVVGQRQGMAWGEGQLEREVGGCLSLHVEVASSLRVGDIDHALSALDNSVNTAVISLGTRASSTRGMRQARLYRDLVPSAGAGAEQAGAVLASVSPAETVPTQSGLARLRAQLAQQ